MKIISSKYLLDQEKKLRREKEERAALELQKIQQQQLEQNKARVDKIKEGLRLSYVAYNDNRVAQYYLADHGFSNFLPLDSWMGTQGLCCIRQRQACLAFRGTDSLLDGLIDLLFIPWYRPTIHFGFGRSWRSVRKEVRKWLELHKSEFDTIALYGHSLGGAIAHVAALELASEFEIAEVVTFGAPRSSFLFTRESYDELRLKNNSKKTLRSVTIRVVNKLDLISKVPFSWSGYHHVGSLVYLSADGQVYLDEKAQDKQENEGFLEPVFRLLIQENKAMSAGSTSNLFVSPTPATLGFGTPNNFSSPAERLFHLYQQAKLYVPLIQVPVQFFFILIAPFILLFGFLLYISRSGSSHLRTDYTRYLSDASTRFEEDLEVAKQKLDIPGPNKLLTFVKRWLKVLLTLALIIGILYMCYWLFTTWTWPLFMQWIEGQNV
jgi:pimeloyl-ACP methyl ester carboxylesterase